MVRWVFEYRGESNGTRVHSHEGLARLEAPGRQDQLLKLRKMYQVHRGSSKGVIAIEVIIALAIMGITAVAFLSGLATTLNATRIVDERSVAQSLATSQMEYVKSQGYITAPSGGEAIYSKIDLTGYADYSVRSINRDGNAVDDIIGVPWDTEASPPAASYDDNGIQKITITIKHGDKVVLTLEDYKVNR